MPALPSDLRNLLEKSIIAARTTAEEAARVALTALGVERDEAPAGIPDEQRRLRRALRARARQLGDGQIGKGIAPLIEEIAYEQWHRMLFARFLAENDLLMHPDGVAVTLADCAELAAEEGETDPWLLAARYASGMLPGIFRLDDPSAQARLAPEGRAALERILAELPPALFTADDALGWVYQFWQTKVKKEVNEAVKGGRKVGAEELPAVTQLFTEDYMVRFLLENSLGAWWAARHPESPLLKDYIYLRYRDDGRPAAGTFPGWPERAAEVTVMDPCCGSGHFVVAAFEMLRRMRMEEERLGEAEAGDAVIRENVFGLEIDPRCTQIAAFALALAAWKAGGYRALPLPNIACSGIPVVGQLDEWKKLAGDDVRLATTLERLHSLFREAPTLGSLINPADTPLQGRLFESDYTQVAPLLRKALAQEHVADDPVAAVFGSAVEGVARAAELLARTYTLVATNVPYLGQNKQSDVLKQFCDVHHSDAKTDLATAFVERCYSLLDVRASCALVTPQNWWFLNSYKKLRMRLLSGSTWNLVSRLGPGAFETISGEVVKAALLILTNRHPSVDSAITGIDVSHAQTVAAKAYGLSVAALHSALQSAIRSNPDSRITIGGTDLDIPLLAQYADSYWGLGSGDIPRFARQFWELPRIGADWVFLQVTFPATGCFTGRDQILFWQNGKGDLVKLADMLDTRPTRGHFAWGHRGVAISQMGGLAATLYTGEIFQNGVAAIIPKDPHYLPAIWAYCSSPEYRLAVREIDQKLSVTNATLVKVPFDLAHWQKVAEEAGPLPEPYSNDPTQWLFKGDPTDSTAPLQVAVARLLGYRWPQQAEGSDRLDALAIPGEVACLPAVAGEAPLAERLRALLAATWGSEWSPAKQEELLAGVGYAGKTLDDWLRDKFFEQHCALFHNRPFIWHVWDGRKDGFSALVNYHKLDAATLNRIIYTYLNGWIATQQAERDAGVAGADGRLVAALELKRKLEAIRDGEPPYDIYVRWKPLEKQSLGWEPDLNDGVRLNVRPFVMAGVLRNKFNVKWEKDRGKNPGGSERLNDLHYTRAEKEAARAKARAGVKA